MSDFYQDQRKIELRVGIIAVICIIILVIGYAWLRNALNLHAMTELKVRFTNAQGIEVGDKVAVNGMEAGRVNRITQLSDGVLLTSRLNLKYPIRQGARFIIQDSNLMGGKQLDIINSDDGKPIDSKQIQNGESSYGMTALLNTAAITMQQINTLLNELNKPGGLFTEVQSTFNETKNTFGKVNATLDASKENFNNALKDISSSARQLNELISQNKPNLDKSIAMAPNVLQKAQATLDSLQAASSALQNTITEISKGKGTLSSLIQDDKLYRNLLQSTARLDSLLIDIKHNPKRYFKIKVF